ncbi:MAG TPA: DUF2891 domain-containing protein [Rhizomicrobium sp.]|nr:DUF2891 domain-containing protein [Rhizomicrobium sp.]
MILDQALAERFARIALGHVRREYPNKLDHVLEEAEDAQTPRALHPIFYGSYDWHSCVHGYWMLARLLRLFPDNAHVGDITMLFDDAFVEDKVADEAAYLTRLTAGGFERPYGWAWALMLAAELGREGDRSWAGTFKPLEDAFVARFFDYLPKLTYPIRAGTHGNTAFALVLAEDYARAVGNEALRALLARAARRWFGNDCDAPAWEPSGDDFLSPTLIEALCMKRLLPADEFAPWFDAFLPRRAAREPKVLFEPAIVSDRRDGKIVHLDGVNLSRAWCMRALGADFGDAAERHIEAALGHVAGDYMGEHWLASFAVLALTASRTGSLRTY